MFSYLCYVYALRSDISSISIKLEIQGHSNTLLRNRYINYSVEKIKEDLENLKILYRENSDIDINFSTKQYIDREG